MYLDLVIPSLLLSLRECPLFRRIVNVWLWFSVHTTRELCNGSGRLTYGKSQESCFWSYTKE